MTNAYLNVKMPGKVVIVDSFDDLPNASDAVENTLYIIRFNSNSEEETTLYEFVNGDYRSLDLSTFSEDELEELVNQIEVVGSGLEITELRIDKNEDDIEELQVHPPKLVSVEEVHGFRYEDNKLYIRLADATLVEFDGGGGSVDLSEIEQKIEVAIIDHESKTVFKDKVHGLSVDGGILEYWDHNKEEWVELFASEFQTYPRVRDLQLTSSPDGDYVEVSFENPVSPTYSKTEVYISEQDITSSDREDLASISTLIIDDGTTTTHQHDATRNKTYFVMAYAVHEVDGETHYASPRSASVRAQDTNPPDDVTDIVITSGDERLAVQWANPTNDDYVKTRGVYKRDSVPTNQNDGTVFVDGTEEGKVITGLENGETYYVRFFTYDFSENVNSSEEMIANGTPSDVQVSDTGPGPQELIAGDMEEGFFGEVPASDLFTGSELASLVGISQGNLQHSNEPWLKFAYEGRILFVAKKPIRSHVSWNAINDADCVYGKEGDAVVTKDGFEFIVRLLKGALTDPSKYDESDRGAKYSEWNRLMLPIHEEAINKDWGYSQYVEDDIPLWSHGLGSGKDGFYNNSDLVVSSGSGRASWCQETRNTTASNRVNRGYNGVSYSYSATASNTNSNRGWRPALELSSL